MMGMMTYHLVNSFNNLEHFFIANLAIAIDIVELESPVELILHLAAARNAQGTDELLEIDGAGLITVKHIEDVICK